MKKVAESGALLTFRSFSYALDVLIDKRSNITAEDALRRELNRQAAVLGDTENS